MKSKSTTIFIIVLFTVIVIFVICMLIASYVFKPTVILHFNYAEENHWAFLLDEETEDKKPLIVVNVKPVRFSHYEPPILNRNEYVFAGWYRDIGYTVAWINGRDTVSRDITLYAKWVKAT